MSAAIGRFATHNAIAIMFITVALCLAGVYAALKMPSSVFPQTDFPRCVILIDNGVMPADEMMATITRPIEEAMKDVPGAAFVRSATGRGSAEVNVFFTWQADMIQSELYVNSRLAQVRSTLPATATAVVWRLTFSAFPIIGVSLISQTRDITALWETARYDIKPRFLRVPGVARRSRRRADPRISRHRGSPAVERRAAQSHPGHRCARQDQSRAAYRDA